MLIQEFGLRQEDVAEPRSEEPCDDHEQHASFETG